MKLTRNRCFLLGVLLILFGIQFRMVESFVLNEQATRALAKVSRQSSVASRDSLNSFLLQVHPKPTKRVTPPRWLGLACIAVGSVLTLHAVAMPKT